MHMLVDNTSITYCCHDFFEILNRTDSFSSTTIEWFVADNLHRLIGNQLQIDVHTISMNTRRQWVIQFTCTFHSINQRQEKRKDNERTTEKEYNRQVVFSCSSSSMFVDDRMNASVSVTAQWLVSNVLSLFLPRITCQINERCPIELSEQVKRTSLSLVR
jgi:hypothetical protein